MIQMNSPLVLALPVLGMVNIRPELADDAPNKRLSHELKLIPAMSLVALES